MVKSSKVSTMSVCGGALPLDFLNTVSQWTPSRGDDYFENDADFLLWTQKLAFMERQDFEMFSRYVKKQSSKANILKSVRALRQTLFHLFQPIASGQRIAPESLEAFSAWAGKAHARIMFTHLEAGIKTRFSDAKPDVLPLYYIVLETEKMILDSASWTRIRMCAACGWFFFDTSKGGRRRWCDMAVCGSRDKALRYYHNTKS